jgi:ribonuclease BN (tRNA processing enzyme)
MSGPFLPFGLDDLAAEITVQEVEDGEELTLGDGTTVFVRRLSHPGGVLGYRIAGRGHSVVYATDVSHPAGGLDPELVGLARGAELLIHDAHFCPDEKPERADWGHSTWLEAVQVARSAGVHNLALYHHAPARPDAEVERIEREAQAMFPAAFAAREGMEVVV